MGVHLSLPALAADKERRVLTSCVHSPFKKLSDVLVFEVGLRSLEPYVPGPSDPFPQPAYTGYFT